MLWGPVLGSRAALLTCLCLVFCHGPRTIGWLRHAFSGTVPLETEAEDEDCMLFSSAPTRVIAGATAPEYMAPVHSAPPASRVPSTQVTLWTRATLLIFISPFGLMIPGTLWR